MVSIRVAINGFGRIGRLALRAILEQNDPNIELVAINSLGDPQANVHLLKYDSTHGILDRSIRADDQTLYIDEKPITIVANRDVSLLPWGDLGVDIVYECTGSFVSKEKSQLHLDAGAKRVLISAPAKGDLKTIVYGVNHDLLTADDHIVSNASCTTNCLAPVAHVLNETVGIEKGFMTTVHSYTKDQPTLDSFHRDLRRARSSACSMIPTSTGAAKALGLVLPSLKGKLDGHSIRVPTPNVSLIDLTFVAQKNTTAEEINQSMIDAAQGSLKGVLQATSDPVVSIDLNHNPHSCVFDLSHTQVIEDNFVRILSWYDNEWAFSHRMVDTARIMGKFL